MEPRPSILPSTVHNSTEASSFATPLATQVSLSHVSLFVTHTTTVLPATRTAQAALTTSSSSIIHTNCEAIQREIQNYLPKLCQPTTATAAATPTSASVKAGSTLTVPPTVTSAHVTSASNTKHAFIHRITMAYTASNRPIVVPIEFNLNLETTFTRTTTTITLTTPVDATTVGFGTPVQSPVPSSSTAIASSDSGTPPAPQHVVCANVSGTIIITPSPYKCALVTATFSSAVEDENSAAATDQPTTPGDTPPASPAWNPTAPNNSKKRNPNLRELAAAERAMVKTGRENLATDLEARDAAKDEDTNENITSWVTPVTSATKARTKKGTVRGPKGTARNPKGTARSSVSTIKIMTTKLKMMGTKKTQLSATTHRPAATVTKILDHLLNLIPALHKKYARYDEVDAAMYAHFESTIPNSPPIQPHESALVDTSLTFDDQNFDSRPLTAREEFEIDLMGVRTDGWKRIPNTIASPVAFFQKIDDDSSAWGKAVATVDASHTHVFSYLWNQHSYDHINRNADKEGADALNKVVFPPDSRSMLRANIVNFGLAVSARVFSTWLVWRQEPDESFTIAIAPMSDYKRFNSATVEINNALDGDDEDADAVRGTVKGFWRIKPLAPEVCQITYVVQAQAGGSLPRALLNTRIKSTLSVVHNMQDKFSRNGKFVDGQVRAALGAWNIAFEDTLTPEQLVLYRQSRALNEDADPSTPDAPKLRTALGMMLRTALGMMLRTARGMILGTARGMALGSAGGTSRGTARGSVRNSVRGTGKAARASVRLALGLRSKESTWLDLPPTSPFVTMGMQYKPTQAGQAPTVLAEAQTVVDCCMEEAYAWFMMAAGRERTRRHLEYGDLAHVMLNDRSLHDRTVATIRKTPFRLTNREYVVRSLGVMNCGFNPSVNVALTSEEVGKVDYGQSFRIIRGHLTGLVVIKSFPGKNMSEITFTVQWSGKGNLPPWAMRTEIVRTLSVVDELRMEVQRNDELDKAEVAELANAMREGRQNYTREEMAQLRESTVELAALKSESFEALENPDPAVSMLFNYNGAGLLRAIAAVDASVEDCVAFETAKMSRSEQQRHFEEDGLERSLEAVNAHSGTFHVVRRLDFLGAQPREWLVQYVWKWKDEKKEEMMLSYETLDNNEEYPANPSYAKVKFSSMWVFKRLKEVGRVHQTLVTVTMRVNLRGLTQGTVRGLGLQLLGGVSLMRKRFDRSLEVDEEVRAEKMKMIADHDDAYDGYERVCLFEGGQHFARFKEMKAKSLTMASPLTTSEIAFEKNDSHAWGRATTTVRASPEEVLAFLWDPMRRSARREEDLKKSVEEHINGHNMLVYNKERTPKIIRDRDFLGRSMWKKEGEGYLLVTRPEVSDARPVRSTHSDIGRALNGVLSASSKSHEKSVARGKFPSAMRIKRKNDWSGKLETQRYELHELRDLLDDAAERKLDTQDLEERIALLRASVERLELLVQRAATIKETTIEYVIHPDAGGRVPSFIMSRYLGTNLRRVTDIQEYFQELRSMEDYDADDGKALSVRLMHRGGETGKKPWQKVRDVVEKHCGLKELSIEYDWLIGFLEEVVRGRWVMAASVGTKLVCLSEMEARKIGRSLMPALKQRKTAEAGLHQWKMQNRSMLELFERYDWVESMMLEVAQEVMKTAPWGLMWRVCTGASLSILDMVTDVVVIVSYMGKRETRGYGYSLIGMLVGSMVLQLLLVFAQHRKKPGAIAKEILVVITGMKGAFNAFKVCSGQKMEKHHLIDAKTELAFTKCIEMVCESIPGCLLQMFVILKLGDTGKREIASVVISALTTGYNSATVSYDVDSDPMKRKETPDFYGYIPDEGIARPLLLVCMTLNSALLLLVRAFSAAMIILVKKRYFVAFMAGDMVLYLLQKVARGDFHYWIPIDGAAGLFMSLVMRVMVKTITDFTGLIQFRHHAELGGLFWTVNMFLALLTSFVSVLVHYADTGKVVELIATGQNATAFEIEERTAWTLVGSLSGAWVVVFGVFLSLMKKEYRGTFFSTRKGKQWTMDFFLKGTEDAVKKMTVDHNKAQWWAIREDVKEWVQANWWRWKEEKSEWFDLAWQSQVPKEWITDAEERARLDEERESGRGSFGASLRVSVLGAKGEDEVGGGGRVEPVA